MFKNRTIKYFRVKDDKLFVKYKYLQEEFLTSDKVDLKEFKNREIIDEPVIVPKKRHRFKNRTITLI